MSIDLLNQMLMELKTLGCCGVKVSFEDEGALLNEIVTMRYLTASNGLELAVKIGGCEAKRDIVDAMNVCTDCIVAPMVESEFALRKFSDSLKQYRFTKKRGINIETQLSVDNVGEMANGFDSIDFVTFGRSDFACSIGKTRNSVDTDRVFESVEKVFMVARSQNIGCYLGGSISSNTKDFILRLINKNLLDKFETRYAIYDVSKIDMEQYDTLIRKAKLFEIEWIRYISNRYAELKDKDALRINVLFSQMNN